MFGQFRGQAKNTQKGTLGEGQEITEELAGESSLKFDT